MNQVTLIGNIGKDPEVRFTQSGAAVATFSLATSFPIRKGGNTEWGTDWHNIVVWGDLAELATELTKGTRVVVVGQIKTRSYEDKNGQKRYTTEVVAKSVTKDLVQPKRQSNGFSDMGQPVQMEQDEIPF